MDEDVSFILGSKADVFAVPSARSFILSEPRELHLSGRSSAPWLGGVEAAGLILGLRRRASLQASSSGCRRPL